MAVLSAFLLALGVGWHYVDIYRNRTVRGISFLFVAIDAAGDLFSLLSLGGFLIPLNRRYGKARANLQSFMCRLTCLVRSFTGLNWSCGLES